MRTKEELKESGYFWLPSAPDTQIPGILSISDGDVIKLELFGVFGTLDEPESVERIVGHIQKGGFVTLDGCYCWRMSSSVDTSRTFDDISKSLIDVTRVFKGIAYREGEVPRFDTLTFSVEGIDDWVGISGIEVDHQLEQQAATISYKLPENITLRLDNGMELLIVFSWQPPPFSLVPKEAKITQKTHFHLVSQYPRELEKFISVAENITAFLCFAMDNIVCLDSMSTIFNTPEQDIRELQVEDLEVTIYAHSWPYSKNDPKVYQHNMLLEFKKIQNDIENIINKWIKAYERVTPAFRFYFWTQMGAYPYSEVKFLTLVQGLEAYHRKMFNENRMNLRNRIEEIINPFQDIIGTNEEREKLITSIMDTRNYWTHYNPKLESRVAQDWELEILCSKIEALFQLHFLQLLDFSREEIRSIAWNCQELRRKLRQ